jgi:hypothetical protein
MKFAAGLTVSGIIGFVLLEVLKFLLPTLAAWILALFTFVVKAILFGIGLAVLVAVIGIAIFIYKRSQRSRGED